MAKRIHSQFVNYPGTPYHAQAGQEISGLPESSIGASLVGYKSSTLRRRVVVERSKIAARAVVRLYGYMVRIHLPL